jgi:hypothetical protein
MWHDKAVVTKRTTSILSECIDAECEASKQPSLQLPFLTSDCTPQHKPGACRSAAVKSEYLQEAMGRQALVSA